VTVINIPHTNADKPVAGQVRVSVVHVAPMVMRSYCCCSGSKLKLAEHAHKFAKVCLFLESEPT
jgi:hypothetical protein